MEIAFACRYGGQDFFRLTGRDPMKRPLTEAELQLFKRAVLEHVVAERKERAS